MKLFVRSVPAMLLISAVSLSMIALVGCGASGGGGNNAGGGNNPSGPAAAKTIYVIQYSVNATTGDDQQSVLVFSASATGSTTPASTLNLPSGFYGLSLAVGPQGQIYVGGITNDGEGAGQILEYAAGASGSATPTVTLNGSYTETTTFDWPGALAVNSAGTLVVSSDDGTLESFASGFTASSAPTQYLTWGHNTFYNDGRFVGIDTAGDIFYGDTSAIDVFVAGATGAAAPTRIITGTSDTTPFDELHGMAVDGAGDVYVANHDNYEPAPFDSGGTIPVPCAANKRAYAAGLHSADRVVARPHDDYGGYEPTGIIEFAAGANGTPTPLKRISGSATNIVEPDALAVDAVGNLYYVDANGDWLPGSDTPLLLEVFSSSASGNVAPTASMSSTDFTVFNSRAVAVR